MADNTFMDPVQYHRRKTMLDECAKLGTNYSGTLPDQRLRTHMIYDEKTGFVFCDLPKVGSTFLKQVLHIVSGHSRVKDPYAISGSAAHTIPFQTFVTITYDQILKLLVQSTKFLFVRDPYTRILSGYVDKLYTNNFVFWGSAGKLIVNNYRKDPSKKSKACGHDSSFPEFIKHVIDSETKRENRNPHWYPMYDACRPCSVKYDVIGKIESFKEDLDKFLHTKNVHEMVDISHMNKGNDNEAIALTLSRAYDVVAKMGRCITIAQALERAWKVLQVRGVISQLADFPYDAIKKNPNITQENFVRIITQFSKRYPMSPADKALSREQAVVNAYMSVPWGDLRKFHSIFHPDFVLFGYAKKIGNVHNRFLKWEPFKLKL